MLPERGDEDVEIDSGAAEPAVERLAARELLGGKLRHVEECAVDGKNTPVEPHNDETVRKVLDDAQETRLGARHDDRAGPDLDRSEPHEEV
jgi:hypothetical protein